MEKKIKFLKKTFSNMSLLIVILLIYLLSGSIFQTIIPNINLLIIPMCLICFFYCFYRDKFTFNKSYLILLIFFLMVFFTLVFDEKTNAIAYIKFLMFPIVGFTIAHMEKKEKIAKIFCHFMVITSAISIPFYILLNYSSLLDWFPKVYNSNGVQYGVGIVFNYLVNNKDRNCSVFWEPGIFASFLAISFLLEVLFLKKHSFFHQIIYFFGFFSAHSSAGYILALLCVCFWLFKGNSKNRKSRFLISLFNNVILILLIFFTLNFDYILENTNLGNNQYLLKLSVDNINQSARVSALTHNLNVFFNNFLFGAGMVEVERQMVYCGDISTSTYLMSIFGLLGTSYTILFIIGIFRQKNINFHQKIIFTIIMLLIINKEPHSSILFTWVILFLLNETEHSKNVVYNSRFYLTKGVN